MAAAQDPSGGGLFLLLCIVLGLFCRNLLTKPLPMPYTVMLLLLGVLIGGLARWTHHSGQFGNSVEVWSDVNPHLLLYLFMPILVFEIAFSVDYHVFMRELKRAMVLSIPGQLIAAALTATVVMYLLPVEDYGWGWAHAIMLAGILGSTDPVAVVTLLREKRLSENLATLIEAESMLNDGPALAIFTVFLESIATNTAVGVGATVWFFLRVAVGGAFLGAIVAFLVVACLRYVYNDAMTEISLTLVGCYICFVIGEGTLHVSGVLSVVSFGVLMSGFGKPHFTPELQETLHSFWSMMGYVANTVIFVITGSIMVDKAFASNAIEWYDGFYVLLLYGFLQLIRALVVGLASPLLLYTGTRLEKAHLGVISFSGLRGAIGLSLALIVEEDHRVPRDTGDRVLFYCAGIALLTLLINGSSMLLLLKWTGLLKKNPEVQEMFELATKKLHAHTHKEWRSMQGDEHWLGADLDKVWHYVPIVTRAQFAERQLQGQNPPISAVPGLPGRLKRRWKRYYRTFGADTKSDAAQVTNPLMEMQDKRSAEADDFMMPAVKHMGSAAVHQLCRRRYAQLVRATYWHNYEHGYCTPESMQVLLAAEARALRRDHRALDEWSGFLAQQVQLNRTLVRLGKCTKWDVCNIRRGYIPGALSSAYEVTANFIDAHQVAARVSKTWNIGDQLEHVVRESQLQVALATEFMEETMEKQHPELCASIRTRHAVRVLLRSERLYIDQLLHEGAIDDGEHGMLVVANNASVKKAMATSTHGLLLGVNELLRRSDLSNDADHGSPYELTATQRQQIVNVAKPRVFEQHEQLFKQGQAADGWYIVASGFVVLQSRAGISMRLGAGSAVGLADLLLRTKRRFTAVAASITTAYFVSDEAWHALLWEKNSASPRRSVATRIHENAWRAEGLKIAQHFVPRLARCQPSSVLRTAIFTSTVLWPVQAVNPDGGYLLLLRGAVSSARSAGSTAAASSRSSSTSPYVLISSAVPVTFKSGSVVLKIDRRQRLALEAATAASDEVEQTPAQDPRNRHKAKGARSGERRQQRQGTRKGAAAAAAAAGAGAGAGVGAGVGAGADASGGGDSVV